MATIMTLLSAVLPESMRPEALRYTAAWIRDSLDPVIAREGPEVMWPDDCLKLQELFQNLQIYPLDKSVMSATRIHNAVLEVAGKATRWPHRLADECDKVRPSLHNSHNGICLYRLTEVHSQCRASQVAL